MYELEGSFLIVGFSSSRELFPKRSTLFPPSFLTGKPRMECCWHHDSSDGEDLCLLPRTLPRCDSVDPSGPSFAFLHFQFDISLHPHLSHFLPGLLSSGGIRREGEPRTHNPAGIDCLSTGDRRNAASNTGLYPTPR